MRSTRPRSHPLTGALALVLVLGLGGRAGAADDATGAPDGAAPGQTAARGALRPEPVPEAAPPKAVSFTTADGAQIQADLYGEGARAVVLAHGARFDKESWAPQARALAAAGFQVLALDFRGYGDSHGPGDQDPLGAPLHQDVLGAVRYLRGHGAREVSVVGGSLGGTAAADAALTAEPGAIDAVVVLAARASLPAAGMAGRKLFIVARDDLQANGTPRLVGIREQFQQLPEPKQLIVLDGSAHAQHLFETDQGPRLLDDILGFLTQRDAP